MTQPRGGSHLLPTATTRTTGTTLPFSLADSATPPEPLPATRTGPFPSKSGLPHPPLVLASPSGDRSPPSHSTEGSTTEPTTSAGNESAVAVSYGKGDSITRLDSTEELPPTIVRDGSSCSAGEVTEQRLATAESGPTLSESKSFETSEVSTGGPTRKRRNPTSNVVEISTGSEGARTRNQSRVKRPKVQSVKKVAASAVDFVSVETADGWLSTTDDPFVAPTEKFVPAGSSCIETHGSSSASDTRLSADSDSAPTLPPTLVGGTASSPSHYSCNKNPPTSSSDRHREQPASERHQRRRLSTSGSAFEESGTALSRGPPGNSGSSSGSSDEGRGRSPDDGRDSPGDSISSSSSEDAPSKRTEPRQGSFSRLPSSSSESLAALESFRGEGTAGDASFKYPESWHPGLQAAGETASNAQMGNCFASSKRAKESTRPIASLEAGKDSNEPTASHGDTPTADKPKEQWPSSPRAEGSRRRLSLVHAEPITHPEKDVARGKLEIFEKKPKTLETKLSLERMLNDPTSQGARMSISGAATRRVQGNFEPKNETLRGNVHASALAHLGIGHACKKGLKPESPNQDDFFIYHLERVGLYGVFDGHGPFGHDISNFVQQTMPKLIYNNPQFDADPSRALTEAFAKIQGEIRVFNDRREFDASLSGCTATIIIHDMEENRLTVGHVGDSRAVLAQGGPSLQALDLTEDHKPTLPRELERIERAGGEVKRLEGDVPHRVFLKNRLYPGLAMSRALGDLVATEAGVSCEPEVKQFDLEPGRDLFIVLCSDGVWEFISSQEAVEMVNREGISEVQSAADSLARESWNKWITEEGDIVDDITVEVIYLFPDIQRQINHS